jgi:hypothetical protein
MDLHLRLGVQGHLCRPPDDGCCTLGAHFTDDEDVARVQAVVDELTPKEWEKRPKARPGEDTLPLERWTEMDEDARKTKVKKGACIFLNSPGFAGGGGCALHNKGVRTGRAPHTMKPDVCWQLPIRRSYRNVKRPDGTSYLEITITEFDRRGWGAGGHDLDWYCSADPQAHIGKEPVFRSNRGELIALMGEEAYAELEIRCQAHLTSIRTFRSVEARKLLPLLVHPATVAAKSIGGKRP